MCVECNEPCTPYTLCTHCRRGCERGCQKRERVLRRYTVGRGKYTGVRRQMWGGVIGCASASS